MLGEAGKKPVNPAAKKPAVKKKLRAGESEEFPGYFWKGGVYYSNVSKDGQVTHKKDKGRMVVLTNQEKAEYRAKRAGKSPAKPAQPAPQAEPQQRFGSTGVDADLEKQKQDADVALAQSELERKSGSTTNAGKKKILDELLAAIKSRNPEQIQKVLTDYGIEMSPQGKLKATTLGKGDAQKLVPDSKGQEKQFAAKIAIALQSLGVELPGGKKTTDTVNVEDFKPQSLYGDPEDVLDVTPASDGSGIDVEGTRIEEITDDDARQVEERWLSAARERLGEDFTPEWENNIKQYVRARVREQNANIRFIRKVSEERDPRTAKPGSTRGKYTQFPRNDETSEQASTRMVTALSGLVDGHIADPSKNAAAKTALNDMVTYARAMSTAKTSAERREAFRAYNAALAAFQAAAKGTPVAKNMKYVAESLKALQSVAQGKTVLIPADDSFPLADVITIGKSPITGENSIELFLVSVEEGITASAAESVKFDDGSAGVTHQKDGHSEFGPTRGTDGSEIPREEVRNDLVGMGGTERKNEIFTRDGKLSPAARQRVIDEIEKYGDVAREYFGLPTDPNAEGYLDTEQLYEFLSYGTAMTCVDGKPAHGPRLAAGDENRGSENPEQWKAWNTLGLLHEAVHNSLVTQQFYQTAQFTRNGLVVADGVRTMARAVFQPYKNLVGGSERTPRVGKVPDSSMVSFSVPAEENDLRSGNPCNEK